MHSDLRPSPPNMKKIAKPLVLALVWATLVLGPSSVSAQGKLNPDAYAECGKSATCIGLPDRCSLQNGACKASLEVIPAPDKTTVTFRMRGTTEFTYVSGGFSRPPDDTVDLMIKMTGLVCFHKDMTEVKTTIVWFGESFGESRTDSMWDVTSGADQVVTKTAKVTDGVFECEMSLPWDGKEFNVKMKPRDRADNEMDLMFKTGGQVSLTMAAGKCGNPPHPDDPCFHASRDDGIYQTKIRGPFDLLVVQKTQEPDPEPSAGSSFDGTFDDCVGPKGCIQLPENCYDEKTKSTEKCDVAMITEYKNPKYEVTIFFQSRLTYAAVSLGPGRSMLDMAALICLKRKPATDPVVIQPEIRWSTTRSREPSRSNPLVPVSVQTETAFTENGEHFVKCKFNLPDRFEITPRQGGSNHIVNLNQKFHVGFAFQQCDGDSGICQHDPNPFITEELQDLKKPDYRKADRDQYVPAHAVLMVITYMFIMPTATIIARFFRESWIGVSLMHRRMWWWAHIILLYTGLLLGGIAIILVIKKNGTFFADRGYFVHAIPGMASYVLFLSQTILHWVIRPQFMNVKQVYSKVHAFVGFVCYAIGIMNIFFTARVVPIHVPCELILVTAVWIPTHLMIYAILTNWLLIKDYEVRSISQQHRWRALTSYPMRVKTISQAPGMTFRNIVLLTHILLSLVFTIISCYMVTSGQVCSFYANSI